MESTESTKRLLRTTHRYAANTTTMFSAAAAAAATTTAAAITPTFQNKLGNRNSQGVCDDMPSMITPNASSDEDAELQSRGISIVDTNTKNFSNVTPEEVSDYYKSLGEWQNVLPKTDYTYSPMSQFYTKKINGNIPIIPNMSRRNIWKMNGDLQRNDMNNFLVQNYAYDERRKLQRRRESVTRLRIVRQIATVTRTIVRTAVRRVYVDTVRTYSSVVANSNRSSGGSFLFNSILLAMLVLLAYLVLPSSTIDSYTISTPFLNLFYSCKNLVCYLYDLTWSSGTFLASLISCLLSNAVLTANTLVFAPIYRLLVLLVSSDRSEPSLRTTAESSPTPDPGDLDAVIRRWFDDNIDNIAKKMVGSNDFVNFVEERLRNREQSEYARFEKFLQSYDFENTRIGAKLKSLEEKVAQWRHEDGRVLEERIRRVKQEIKFNEGLVHKEVVVVLGSLVGSEPSEDDLRRKFASVFDLLEDANMKIHKLAGDFDTYAKNATENNSHTSDRLREELMYNLKATVEDMLVKRLQEWRRTVHVAESTSSEKIAVAENYVTEAIRKALEIYDADKTGKADFALESQGGIILSTRCTETKTANAQFSIFGIPLWHATRSPRTVIQPGVHPGECWAFPGSTGYLVIQLSERITITGFTMEHIPRSLASNGVIDSAPKDFGVWALQWESDPEPRFLGEFKFDDFGYSVQYFDAIRLKEPYQIVELKILSNHGKMDYTCLYRFRVHGIPA